MEINKATGDKGVAIPLEIYNPIKDLWMLRWGFSEIEDNQLEWYETILKGKPSVERCKEIIYQHINKQADEKILSGMVWRDNLIWLSYENQLNYKSAFDICFQFQGATLPITFKFGSNENPTYHIFTNLEELQEFYLSAVQWVQQCLEECWTAKNNVDLSLYGKI